MFVRGPHLRLRCQARLARAIGVFLSGIMLLAPDVDAWADATPLLGAANPDSLLAQALGQIQGTPLSLQQALEQALRGSTAAREAQADLASALGTLRTERGTFDPELFGQAQTSSTDQPTASPFGGADVLTTKGRMASGGTRIRLRTGTQLSASLEAVRTVTNSSFALLVPEYDSAARLDIRQPLLAGFGPSARGPLTAAERSYESSRALYQDAVLIVAADVEGAYWDLYAAERDYAVQQLVRDQAQAFLQAVQLRAQAGLVGPGDVASARVFLAEQEQAMLDREEQMDAASDRLATLLGQRPGSGHLRFRPTNDPPREFPVAPPDSLVAWAQRRNQDLKSKDREVAAARARERAAAWDARPDLDLFGSLGGTGLVGDPQTVTFGNQSFTSTRSGGLGDALRQAVGRDFPNWTAGLSLTVPLSRRARGGERDRLRAEVARAEQHYTAAARSLEDRVRDVQRQLLHGTQRLTAAHDGADAALERARIGVIEYRNGRTTAFELVRLGADAAAAQQRYSQALVRSAKAAARLRQLTDNAYPGEAAQ
jgi:outer membrane protein